ncbi:hypothetical protein MM213_17060 [Belliella sp. R4-6]|uniref:Uncharacterized protein n=1 Tax=Belliella alkalica TaxID=1730871 RepID=A0ABS9VFM3_9BACT|nr:hypothetical protein [Belliella alkalica]MCH7415213.1 hypothetical protein [Belliella alkalica]
MKRKIKIVLANVFALLSVVVFLLLGNLFGIDFRNETTPLLAKALLMIIPQIGFVYLYWMSLKVEDEKESDYLN